MRGKESLRCAPNSTTLFSVCTGREKKRKQNVIIIGTTIPCFFSLLLFFFAFHDANTNALLNMWGHYANTELDRCALLLAGEKKMKDREEKWRQRSTSVAQV